jgi:hypothetical protein
MRSMNGRPLNDSKTVEIRSPDLHKGLRPWPLSTAPVCSDDPFYWPQLLPAVGANSFLTPAWLRIRVTALWVILRPRIEVTQDRQATNVIKRSLDELIISLGDSRRRSHGHPASAKQIDRPARPRSNATAFVIVPV